jgi:hypothetical protein
VREAKAPVPRRFRGLEAYISGGSSDQVGSDCNLRFASPQGSRCDS